MMNAKSCLDKAAELDSLASSASDPDHRATLLSIARRWREMASMPAFSDPVDEPA